MTSFPYDPGPTQRALCEEFRAWCRQQGLPLLPGDDPMLLNLLTSAQRRWFMLFVDRWDAATEGLVRASADDYPLPRADSSRLLRGGILDALWDETSMRQHARALHTPQPFQPRVDPWLISCFGTAIARDGRERNHRFLEEALELVQAAGCTASEAHQLVDYTFGRPVGEVGQEVGGVMITLAALCLALDLDMHAAGEAELARIWTMVEKIRAKQAAKPKHSPLPEHTLSQPWTTEAERAERLKAAIEGECDGLAIDDVQARAILAFVETGLPPEGRRTAGGAHG